jgi:acyl transferase domain-containing protein
MLSARSEAALQKSTDNLVTYLKQEPEGDIADVAYTLQVGRRRFPYRRFVLCSDFPQACEALQKLDPERVHTAHVERQDRSVAFLFPGQGSQYVGMGKGMYQQESVFRATVEQCSELLKPELGLDLKDLLYPGDDKREESAELLNQTWMTQPALFVVEYALARLLASWGVRPEAMIGHSIGEYVAACLAEVLSLEEALKLVAVRGRLMQSLPPGAMLAAGISEGEAQALIGDQISLAAVNGPMQCVFSGEEEAITELEQHLQLDGVTCQRLRTSHAFHSQMVEPILGIFAEEVRRVRLQPPRIRYLSNVTGQWIKAEDATSPEYWVRHLRHTVRFSQAIEKLLEDPNWMLVEVGPGRALTQMARRHTRGNPENTFFTTLFPPETDHLGILLGQLWLGGASIRWPAFYSQERRRRMVLPTYPFERQRYWIEPKKRAAETGAVALHANAQPPELDRGHAPAGDLSRQAPPLPSPAQLHPRPKLKTPYIPPATELEKSVAAICIKVLGVAEVGLDDIFFELGGDSLMALQVVAGLKKDLGVEVPVVTLYEKLTIRSLAALLQSGNGGSKDKDEDEPVELEEYRQDRIALRKQHQQRERSKRVGA